MKQSQPFMTEQFAGHVDRAKPAANAFDSALITNRLYQVYGDSLSGLRNAFTVADETFDVQPNTSALLQPHVMAAITISNSISEFATIAPRVRLESGIQWFKATDDAATINAAFRVWLENEDLRKSVMDAVQVLDMPNGVEGSRPDQLTEEQRSDPLSSSGENDGKSKKKTSLSEPHANGTRNLIANPS